MIQCQLRMGPRATIYAALAGGNANGGEKKESAHLRCIADTHRPVMHGRVQHGVIPITGSSDFHSFSNFFHIWITCNSFKMLTNTWSVRTAIVRLVRPSISDTFRFPLCRCLWTVTVTVCRPRVVIYFLKAVTTSFQTSIVLIINFGFGGLTIKCNI